MFRLTEPALGSAEGSMHVLSTCESEARRLLALEVAWPDRTFAPDRAQRILKALGTLGPVTLARDPGGHEWAIIVMHGDTPKIVYSLAIDGE